jgi:CHAD domain-containing protein
MPSAPASDVLPALVRRPWRHLRQAVEALGAEPADEALHDVRIQSKRLRYAAEAAAPVIGRPARRLAAAVAEVQGVLGDFNDAVVAEEWLRQAAKSAPASTALVAGQLIAVERRQQQVGRDTWGKPWRTASSKKLRDWLKS